MRRFGRAFTGNQRGSIAILVAVCSTVLLLIAGAAVDFGKAYYVKHAMQTALDAAALAAAQAEVDKKRAPEAVAADLTTIAQNAFDATYSLAPNVAKVKPVKVIYTPHVGDQFDSTSLEVDGSINTDFMNIINIRSLPLKVTSVAQPEQPGPMEIVLVLDVTSSMGFPPTGGTESKLDTLKTAAKALIEKVLKSGSPNIRIGIVPYTTYVNVGLDAVKEGWINPMEYNNDNYCVPAPQDCKPDGNKMTTCFTDRVPYPCPMFVCTASPNVTLVPLIDPKTNRVIQMCKMIISQRWKWIGCVGPRGVAMDNGTSNEFYLDKLDDPTVVKYPGPPNSNLGALACPTTKLVPLTANKATLLNAIDSLTAKGNTFIPMGLIMGWNVIAPGLPYDATSDEALQKIQGSRAIILMTDGINSHSPDFKTGWFYQNNDYKNLPKEWLGSDRADSLTRDICRNINATNASINVPATKVFTVLFDVDPKRPIAKILKDCASKPEYSYIAQESTKLLEAFTDIGNQLIPLRLTQ